MKGNTAGQNIVLPPLGCEQLLCKHVQSRFQATMRTTKKSIQVGPSQQGSRPQKTNPCEGYEGTSSVASSTSKKRKAASRISGPMGSGVFGVRVFVPRGRNPSSPVLHVDLEEHISFKRVGNNEKCALWYNTAMHEMVKAKVQEAGFLPFLSILGHGKKGDRPLLVALAERWWDTTHTFHFDEVGEMTMTPTDFSAITGLRVGGKRLQYDMEMYKNKNKVVKLFGKPIADLLAGERRVPSASMGGYWRAWEVSIIELNVPKLQQVWACEYLKPFALSSPSGSVNTWPRTLRWVGAKSKRDLQHHLEPFRVMMRHLTTDQVNWNPWGTNDSELPEEVQKTVPATRKRILLEGPAGSAWFLGERVTMQSLGTPSPQVPKIPPRTMLADYKLTNESEVEEAVNGYPASEWVAPRSSDYADYRDEYIRYRHYDDLRDAEPQHSTPAGANVLPRISPQPWLVRIPCWANQNGSKVVQIPRGQDCCVIPLPDGVTHVTAEAATELMELNAGLNAVLFSTALEASIEIRRLREENERLKHTSGTGIASSGLAEDVVEQRTEHEFRTKMQHDTRRKGKTKVVLPQEHEEDEEEEEQEEGEEEEEEDQEQDEEEEEEDQEQDESWMDEKEDESEDEEEDGHEEGATSKGKPDAKQHSTEENRKGEKSLRSRNPKRKKTK
ncbi:hypothetical protein Prudu_020472 [Prunus dulcis]|uniref:Aminotransferase-like plant mobile domain-containing protein n=1 Tax=Prunus dulcis TaxID=3755 RepID=A0A4Y1RVD1_PRUDU|nr:hypothetical protein Prudu_020472 [Prunus dulcis]